MRKIIYGFFLVVFFAVCFYYLDMIFPVQLVVTSPLEPIYINFWLALNIVFISIFILYSSFLILKGIMCLIHSSMKCVWNKINNILPLSNKEKKDLLISDLLSLQSIKSEKEKSSKLDSIWKKSGKLKHDIDFVSIYCKLLLSINQDVEVDKIIHDYIDVNNPKPWIKIYSKVKNSNVTPEQRFKWAEEICSDISKDPEIMVYLANLAISASLWSKARSYIDESLQYKNENFEAIVSKGDLYYSLGQEGQALEAYKLAIDMSKKI